MQNPETPPKQIHPKVAEYIARALSGENVETMLDGVPPRMRQEVLDGLGSGEKNPDADSDSDDNAGLSAIPSQYQGLPSEVVEEMWVDAVAVDPERRTAEARNREGALSALRASEMQREQDKERESAARFSSLGMEQRKEFMAYQKEAANIVADHVTGRSRIDEGLSREEAFLLDKLENIAEDARSRGETAPTALRPESELDRKVWANLLNRLAFDQLDTYAKGRDEMRATVLRAELSKPNPVSVQASAMTPEAIAASPEAKPWQEVVRESDVEGVGDLNGSYESFIEHLRAKSLISLDAQGEPEWVGGNAKVVFVGDILGDRTSEGIKVMTGISKLREAAEGAGGGIDVLAGNHEDFFLSFVGGMSINGREAGYDGFFGGAYGYPGVMELLPHASDAVRAEAIRIFEENSGEVEEGLSQKIEKYKKLLTNPNFSKPAAQQNVRNLIARDELALESLRSSRDAVMGGDMEAFLGLAHMFDTSRLAKAMFAERERTLASARNNAEGRESLEAVSRLKLATFQDDTLFVHTDITPGMAALLLRGPDMHASIDSLNGIFQKGLRFYLLGEGTLSEQERKDFYEAKDIFLATSNRKNFTEVLAGDERKRVVDEFKKRGVNLIMHGHNDEGGVALGDPDLPIVSIDRSAFKEGLNKSAASGMTVERDGKVRGRAAAKGVLRA